MLVKCISKTKNYAGGWVTDLVLRSSTGLVFSVTPEQLYVAVISGEIKVTNLKISKDEGKFEYIDIEPCDISREEMNDDNLFVWNFLEKIKKSPETLKEQIVNYINSNDYGIDTEDLVDLIINSDEWYPRMFWNSDTMFRERAILLLERFGLIKADKEDIINRLVDDIIKQARESEVYIINSEWGTEQGYELDTVEKCLSYCNLPESVVDYMKNTEEGYEFVEEIFNIAENRNEIPAFQLAEGKDYCNYAGAYQTMTANYEEAKKFILRDIGELALAQEKSIIEYISDKEVYVIGNGLGKEIYEKIIKDAFEQNQ